jgi:hypothetical protein
MVLARPPRNAALVDRAGQPNILFQRWLGQLTDEVVSLRTGIKVLVDDLADLTGIVALVASGTDGCTITASDAGSDATITISAHTRVYADGTTAAVDGGSVTGLPYSTLLFIFYSDPTRAGGAVAYQASTNIAAAAQIGAVHFVGSVETPAMGGGPNNQAGKGPPGT